MELQSHVYLVGPSACIVLFVQQVCSKLSIMLYHPVLSALQKTILHIFTVLFLLKCTPCRWEFFLEACSLNRAFWAFVLDMVLYTVFQAVLLDNAPAAYRFTPFFGLAAWLVVPKVAAED